MKRPLRFALMLALAGSLASPALADRDRDRHRHPHHPPHEHHSRHDHKRHEARRYCPSGTIQRGLDCLHRDSVRRDARRYPRVGDVLRPADYRRISDPRAYALEPGGDWNYYRDDDRIYQVDSSTRKVMAVLQLLQAFSN